MRSQAIEGVPVEREFATMIQLVRGRAIKELWLALPISKEKTIHRFVMELRNDFVNIRFIPDVRSLTLFSQPMVDLLGVPAINLAASPITDLRVLPKRVFDRLFAFGALTALAPLMLVIAVMVKLSSPGPVFFRQKRKGIDGNQFEIYKFRSMKAARRDGRQDHPGDPARSAHHRGGRVPAPHEPRRAAAVHQRAARRDVGGRDRARMRSNTTTSTRIW